MKKIAVIALSLIICLLLCGCEAERKTDIYEDSGKNVLSIDFIEQTEDEQEADIVIKRQFYKIVETLPSGEIENFITAIAETPIEGYVYDAAWSPYEQGFRILHEDGTFVVVSWGCWMSSADYVHYKSGIHTYNADGKVMEEYGNDESIYYVALAEDYFDTEIKYNEIYDSTSVLE